MKKITILVLSFLVLVTTVGATFVYAEESDVDLATYGGICTSYAP